MRRTALSLFLKANKPDIVLVSETCLTKRDKVQYKDFYIFRSDSTEGKRGTGVLIRKNINSTIVTMLDLRAFEGTGIEIQVNPTETLLVLSIYGHNGSTANMQYDLEALNALLSRYTYGAIGGDFNARHPMGRTRRLIDRVVP